ncbi:MAG: hypothetical protein J6S67_17220 [Methanobrevibacter sp.]|nr:hypothetical protein [Methanobrevibacter sp.]
MAKIPNLNFIANNYMGTPLVPPSLIANTSSQQTLSLLPNSNLSQGNPVNSPVFSNQLSQGLVSSSLVNGNDWITLSNQSVTFSYPSLMVWNNEFYQIPPCNLNVTVQNNTSVLYASKAKAGLNPIETQIGLVTLNDTVDPSEALQLADGQITTVYIPLAVFNGDENGNQTLTWELDKNCQFSAPVLNQFVLLQDFETNAKQFLTNQFTALYNDLTSFASWNTGWLNTPFQVNFNMPQSIANYINPINWGGEGANGVTYTGNSINVNCFTRTLSMCLIGLVWGNQANDGNTGIWEGWSDNWGVPLIYSQVHGGLEDQFANLIPNFSSYTGNNFYYAPSVDLGLQGALITSEGNAIGAGGTYWQKTVIWSAENGNLYTHIGANNESDIGVPYSLVIPSGVSIRLVNGDTGEDVVAMPANPLASPTFNPAWQNSN